MPDATPGRVHRLLEPPDPATGQAETVAVAVDGNEVGKYTTVAGKDATHEVELVVEADGQHELVLSEFEAGGGQMFDAIRMEEAKSP